MPGQYMRDDVTLPIAVPDERDRTEAEQADRRSPLSFVTWYPSCRRSDALARWLGGTSHLIHFFEFKQPLWALAKYPLQTWVTWRRLWQDRPAVIFVASPPVFAPLVVWMYSKCFGVPFVVDAHTGVFDDVRWTWLAAVSRWLSRSALATIVTSETLAARVRAWGARAAVIGDIPVEFPEVPPADLGQGFHVVVVNTFSEDEPLAEVARAAASIPDCRFHVTGNPRHARNRWKGSLPKNARLTGWLSDQEYASLLRAADVVMCLTTRDLTMQRGGYEAVALEKPLVTSDWPLLRDTFRTGTIHVDNSAADIERGIRTARARRNQLAQEMRELRRIKRTAFRNTVAGLKRLMNQHQERIRQ